MHWQINFLPLIDFKKIFLRLTIKIKDYPNIFKIVFFCMYLINKNGNNTIPRLNSKCLINFELHIFSKELKLFVLNIVLFYNGIQYQIILFKYRFLLFLLVFSFFRRIAHCRKSCTYGQTTTFICPTPKLLLPVVKQSQLNK